MSAAIDPLSALAAARATLEANASFWASFLEAATGVVVLGIIVEFVATILEVREEISKGERPHARHIVTFVGAAIVILSCAAEFLAEQRGAVVETGLRQNNGHVQLLLSERADEASERADKATADAVALTKQFGGLSNFVKAQEIRIDAARSSLRKSEATLSQARDEAVKSAARVDAALTAAKLSERQLLAANSKINDLRDEIKYETSPRKICITCLADKVRGFGKIPFVIAASDDNDALNLAKQIASALETAGWEWRADDTTLGYRIPGIPVIGTTIAQGVILQIAQSDQDTLDAPATQLLRALAEERLKDVSGAIVTDDVMKNTSSLHGVVHILVGTRD